MDGSARIDHAAAVVGKDGSARTDQPPPAPIDNKSAHANKVQATEEHCRSEAGLVVWRRNVHVTQVVTCGCA